MARRTRSSYRRLSSSRRGFRSTPYPWPSHHKLVLKKEGNQKKPSAKGLEKKDWEDATCSVCMEFPHHAVLLLCSSHDKGCRPYMCGTTYHFSNCLDQFKKAYTKMMSPDSSSRSVVPEISQPPPLVGSGVVSGWWPCEKTEVSELACPLCRGQVKGWTVVEPAREYLDGKKRSCMQDDCSFVGTYKELRKHVKAEHPTAKPREVDPMLEQKWRRLEREREREDVISTIRTSMPGAMVLGDYVIEGGSHSSSFGADDDEDGGGGFDDDDGDDGGDFGGGGGSGGGMDENWFNFLFLLQAFGNSGGNASSFTSRLRRAQRGYRGASAQQRQGGGGVLLVPVVPHTAANTDVAAAAASGGDGDGVENDDDDHDDAAPVITRRHERGVGIGRTTERRHHRRHRSRSRSGVMDIT